AGKPRLEGERVDGDPAVDGQPGVERYLRGPVHRYTEEKLIWQVTVVAEQGDSTHRIERPYESVGVPVDPVLGESGQDGGRRVRRRWYRRAQRHDQGDLGTLPQPSG